MKLEEQLGDHLRREESVELAYLFGSRSRGEGGRLSDVDVAVYLDESLSTSERFDLRLRLMSEIASLLKTGKVDLVVMNDSPASLNYEAIKGKLIYARDLSRKVEIEHRVMSKYLDRRYYDKRALDAFLRKVSEKGLNW